MTPSALALGIGSGCFTMHVALSLILLRLPGHLSPVARHAGSAAATHVAGVAFATSMAGLIPYWPIAAVSGFGAVVWLFAFSAVYKSVSLRVLTEVAGIPGNEITLTKVTSGYVRPEFQSRVKVLTTMGCTMFDGDVYTLTPKGRSTARRIRAVQCLCGIERSGLYGGPEFPAEK